MGGSGGIENISGYNFCLTKNKNLDTYLFCSGYAMSCVEKLVP